MHKKNVSQFFIMRLKPPLVNQLRVFNCSFKNISVKKKKTVFPLEHWTVVLMKYVRDPGVGGFFVFTYVICWSKSDKSSAVFAFNENDVESLAKIALCKKRNLLSTWSLTFGLRKKPDQIEWVNILIRDSIEFQIPLPVLIDRWHWIPTFLYTDESTAEHAVVQVYVANNT